ncbi:hypothetical protein ACFXD5_05815 [Streptomyces sp. NPDC059385]
MNCARSSWVTAMWVLSPAWKKPSPVAEVTYWLLPMPPRIWWASSV